MLRMLPNVLEYLDSYIDGFFKFMLLKQTNITKFLTLYQLTKRSQLGRVLKRSQEIKIRK